MRLVIRYRDNGTFPIYTGNDNDSHYQCLMSYIRVAFHYVECAYVSVRSPLVRLAKQVLTLIGGRG